jgi:hypothetical protein
MLGTARTPWADACRLIARGDLAGAADVLASIGAKTLEAQLRLQAALALSGTDSAEAARQLELAQTFWHSVDATARLRRADEVAAGLRRAAS